MSILSDAVALANTITKSLQMQAQGSQRVTLKNFISDGGSGNPTYSDTLHDAVVEKKIRQVKTFAGTIATSTHTVTFLDPAVVVKEHDQIFLADGTGGDVMSSGGPVDATGQLLTEAFL